ncbi:MAG TPA: thioredoxin family protein [Hyphomonas sp.]|nr:thioredoxin family protein [Hyphomonas sp.]MCA8904754.1 thioredoxin family protein [Hyphomonas sp.]MCB9960956.1 thioredoxin family protein [Hyphomonas sp.]MCB9970247.1 thioredoxin family protein [Hyphomonas sp.]HPE48639.1 thioredoxin family protein [Hyphomonas sp.]
MHFRTALGASLLLLAACSSEASERAVPQETIDAAAAGVVTYPLALDPACRDGRAKAYDQCSNQIDIYSAALEQARAENKALLVIIGAEWCTWCHAFDATLKGATANYDYINRHKRGDVSQAALDLATYVAANFVVVHVEDDFAPGADEVIAAAGAQDYFQEKYPTIFAVGPDGKFAAKLNHPYVKILKQGLSSYHGYDRKLVFEELKRLHTAALGG